MSFIYATVAHRRVIWCSLMHSFLPELHAPTSTLFLQVLRDSKPGQGVWR